jgi:flagellar protein FliL
MSEVTRPKKSSNLLRIIIAVFLGLILVGGAGFGGYYFASKGTPRLQPAHTTESLKEAYFLAGEFLLNLADTNTRKIIKTKISVGYDSENDKLTEELEAKKDVLEDAIINVIRGKRSTEFQGTGDQAVKKELLTRINSVLQEGKATNVYYKDLIIQ